MATKTELPPSIQGHVRDRHRDRIRLEMSPKQATWVADLIAKAMTSMDIDHPDFEVSFQVYNSLTGQLEKTNKASVTVDKVTFDTFSNE